MKYKIPETIIYAVSSLTIPVMELFAVQVKAPLFSSLTLYSISKDDFSEIFKTTALVGRGPPLKLQLRKKKEQYLLTTKYYCICST